MPRFPSHISSKKARWFFGAMLLCLGGVVALVGVAKLSGFTRPQDGLAANKDLSGLPTAPSTSSGGGRMFGPFDNWLNVQTDYGAVGDGVTDDTEAIQDALSVLGINYATAAENGASRVLYFPAGTYLITATLIVDDGITDDADPDTSPSSRNGIALIGEDPTTTTLKWDGADGGILFGTNMMGYSRIQRLTFDGNGKAHTAIHLRLGDGYGVGLSVGSGSNEGGNELSDLIIKDAAYGIRAGEYPSTGASEDLFLRCQFLRNTTAGFQSNGANTLNIWIRDSYFEDNWVGVTNAGPVTWDGSNWVADSSESGAGHFNVSSSHFKRSSVADMLTHPSSEYFGIRHNTSINSNAFFIALAAGNNGFPLNLQKNLIIDPLTENPIQLETLGPVILLDNKIRSLGSHTGPVVTSTRDLDMISVGNVFTVGSPFGLSGDSPRHFEIDTVTVDRDAFDLRIPPLPETPRWHTGPVIEVAVGATAAEIQQAIDKAAMLESLRPVVHLPAGKYEIDQTLVLPAESRIQLVGDGFFGEGPFGTLLKWTATGDGPVLKLKGPSRATINELMVHGNQVANGIVIETADQPEGRIYSQFVYARSNSHAGIFVDRLDHTLVELHQASSFWQTAGAALKVVGGPISESPMRNACNARTNVFMGNLSAKDANVLDVSRGAKVLLQDMYEENITHTTPFMQLTDRGTVTIDAAKIHRALGDAANIEISGFDGKVSLIGMLLRCEPVEITGSALSSVLVAGMFGLSIDAGEEYFKNSSTTAMATLLNSRYNLTANTIPSVAVDGSYAMPNQGFSKPEFVREMLEHVRTEIPTSAKTVVPDGATNVHLTRVWAEQCLNGFHFKPN